MRAFANMDFSQDKLKQLVKFWVGWEIPMTEMKVEVVDINIYPRASTCFRTLHLPSHYQTYLEFKQSLEMCLGTSRTCVAFDKMTTELGWDKETFAQSAALKKKLEDFDFTLLLGVFQSIFGLTEPLFQVLQIKTVDIKKCQDRIKSTDLKAT
ncbi:unnamed protein product [Gadus morhua 'NCC']